ncbi:unnamed protein product [Parnassius apollo]|uniref:(apollo) hypothetical protein n=1 Tax=Parnassius apollo TaxID=110799 RepID=A0A8S3WJP2_PARAO|nr:unnamed protein product [Parnassius apollo]
MDVLSHYDSAGPSQHPSTHAQTPDLYSSLPENETATAGDGILHNPEFKKIPEEPTYVELQSKRREWTTQIENFTTHHFNGELQSTKFYDHKSPPIDYFNNMFPDELFQVIVNNTNKYARLKNSKPRDIWNNDL